MNPPGLRCEHCDTGFVPDGAQVVLLARSRAKGMRFLMLDCPHCLQGTAVDPTAPGLPRAGVAPPGVPCPVSACTGDACFVDTFFVDTLQPKVWGCGSCGSTWPDRAALDASIAAAIARFPWRRGAYVHTEDGYRAAARLPPRYQDDVAAEWAA